MATAGGLEALRPTKQIVQVLRKYGRMNRRTLWEKLVEENTTIKSKSTANQLLRWLWTKNRVQLHKVTKEEAREQGKPLRWEYEVNETNEQKVERKTKEKYRHPKPKQHYTNAGFTSEAKEQADVM